MNDFYYVKTRDCNFLNLKSGTEEKSKNNRSEEEHTTEKDAETSIQEDFDEKREEVAEVHDISDGSVAGK